MLLSLIGTIAGLYPATVAFNASLPGDIQIPVKSYIAGINWNEKYHRLYYLESGTLHEWPTGRTISLKLREDYCKYNEVRIVFSEDCENFLIETDHSRFIAGNLKTFGRNLVTFESSQAWWHNNSLVKVTSTYDPDSATIFWTDKKIVLEGLTVDDGHQDIAMAIKADDHTYQSTVKMLRLNFGSGRTRTLCEDSGWSEHYPHRMSWNENLKCVALAGPTDTGETSMNPFTVRVGRNKSIGYPPSFPSGMAGLPKWLGSRILCTKEDINGDIIEQTHLQMVYRIVAIEPESGKQTDIVSYSKKHDWPTSQIGYCAYSEATNQLAWFEDTPEGKRIVVRKLDPNLELVK